MRAAAFNCRLKSFMYLYCGAPIDSHKLFNMGQQSLAFVLHLDSLVCSRKLSKSIRKWKFYVEILFLLSYLSKLFRKKEKIHRIYDEYRKPDFPREIQASKLDESSATLVPSVKLSSGLCSPWSDCQTKFGCTGLVLFTSLNFTCEIRFPVLVIYTVDFFLFPLPSVN